MIKVESNKVEIKSENSYKPLAELTLAIKSVKDFLVNNGEDEERVDEIIAFACKLALEGSEEYFEKEIK